MIIKPRRNVVIPTHFGMMMVNRFDFNVQQKFDGVGTHLLNRGTDNLDSMWLLSNYLKDKEKPVIIDVGANIGAFTVQLSQMIESIGGFVYAFEPQRQIYYMFCGNLAMNNVDNVCAELMAVGNSNTPITVPKINYYQPSSFGSVGLTGEFDDVGQDLDFGNGEKIPQIILDEYFKDVENISFLKVDVEGMELDVLKGGEQLIKKYKPIMYVEFYKQHDGAKELRDYITSLGYSIYTLDINYICIPSDKDGTTEFEFLNTEPQVKKYDE
jgi:FkbM family methyltransferase